ncbi:MAG TPA: methylated-DNA--[protein]-cysteine S-methyltransferase [Pirellulales bacterium]|nr:methylated-DNA--[protein]-cysteine S-methyltransferase [Pirellulales bacterium]
MSGSQIRESVQVFPSALGWMALVTADSRVRRLSFGHSTPQAARDDVVWRLPFREETPVCEAKGEDRDSEDEPLVTRLQAYAEGVGDDFLDVELDLGPQTEFQRRVIDGCRRIPLGETLTYGELAERSGYPRAARAVGNCMRTNPIPLLVPCHRVVGSGGAMRGYSAGEGIRMKLRLLELESSAVATL